MSAISRSCCAGVTYDLSTTLNTRLYSSISTYFIKDSWFSSLKDYPLCLKIIDHLKCHIGSCFRDYHVMQAVTCSLVPGMPLWPGRGPAWHHSAYVDTEVKTKYHACAFIHIVMCTYISDIIVQLWWLWYLIMLVLSFYMFPRDREGPCNSAFMFLAISLENEWYTCMASAENV